MHRKCAHVCIALGSPFTVGMGVSPHELSSLWSRYGHEVLGTGEGRAIWEGFVITLPVPTTYLLGSALPCPSYVSNFILFDATQCEYP